jgi:hypothetical protein
VVWERLLVNAEVVISRVPIREVRIGLELVSIGNGVRRYLRTRSEVHCACQVCTIERSAICPSNRRYERVVAKGNVSMWLFVCLPSMSPRVSLHVLGAVQKA